MMTKHDYKLHTRLPVVTHGLTMERILVDLGDCERNESHLIGRYGWWIPTPQARVFVGPPC